MSRWDEVGAVVERLATHGAPLQLKPVVHLEWYAHDAQATVEVFSMGSSVLHLDVFGSRSEPPADVILRALTIAERHLAAHDGGP